MSRSTGITILALGLVLLTGCSDHGDPVTTVTDPGGGGPDPVSFASEVQPIFNANCVGCHGAGGNAGLDLREGLSRTNLVGMAAVGSAGDLVVAGDSAASVLYQRLSGVGGTMPPTGGLPATDIATVQTWIDEGALDN